jgi:predicted RNase H-like HicB family nuclease
MKQLALASHRKNVSILCMVNELKAYEKAALTHATLKDLGKGEGYAARIPGFGGLVVFGDTKAKALAELRTALHDWVALSLRRGMGLPALTATRAEATAHRATAAA